MDYYDLVLGSIPASLLGGTGLLNVIGIDLTMAIPLAASFALGVILHALFVRAPKHGGDHSAPEISRQMSPRRSPGSSE